MSTLADLKPTCPGIVVSYADAQDAVETNLRVALDRFGLFAEDLIRCILAFEGIKDLAESTQTTRLNMLSNRGFLPSMLVPFFQVLETARRATETAPDSTKMRVGLMASLAERLASWFTKSYGPHLPAAARVALNANGVVAAIRENPPADAVRRSARKAASSRASKMQLSEGETRVVIDFQLRAAGWQADTLTLRYSLGARPERGVNKAIAEWQTESGPADYALFSGLDFIGVIEAKKMGKDVIADLTQSKRYSKDAMLDGQARFIGGPWDGFRVPFLFSTNARPFLEQLKEKSGIWFLDARTANNHPRPLQGWYSAEELSGLLQQDIPRAQEKLAKEPMEYLGLREYQEKAILKIEDALNQGRSRLLVAMATGTGKTRLAIGLIYRLITAERFRRILFVVDRTSLGEQAADKFKETRLEDLKTFDQIYDLKEVDTTDIEPTTNIAPPEEMVEVLDRIKSYPSLQGPINESVIQANEDLFRLDQSILSRAFHGRLVLQDPNDEPASVLLKRINAERGYTAAGEDSSQITRRVENNLENERSITTRMGDRQRQPRGDHGKKP